MLVFLKLNLYSLSLLYWQPMTMPPHPTNRRTPSQPAANPSFLLPTEQDNIAESAVPRHTPQTGTCCDARPVDNGGKTFNLNFSGGSSDSTDDYNSSASIVPTPLITANASTANI